MNSINVLNLELSDVFHKLKGGEMEVKTADALANIAGKMIKGQLGQLAYYEQRKETPQIPFWEQPPVIDMGHAETQQQLTQ
jgi:hypothetical protein